MDDLISRKAVIKAVDRHTRGDGTLDDDITVILEEVGTAFDREKVIEYLMTNKKHAEVTFHNDSTEQHFGEAVAYQNSIEIVEKGGVE